MTGSRTHPTATAPNESTPDSTCCARRTIAGDNATIDNIWTRITTIADGYYRDDGGRETPHAKHSRSSRQRCHDAAVSLLTGRARTPSSSTRPQIILGVTLDHDDAAMSSPAPQRFGTGPVADAVLKHAWCDAELVGAVFDTKGQPLWLGRSARTTSNAQLTALIARDHSCVLCATSHNQCEAHHLIPFNAPAKGRTDIDKMALLCGPCHRNLHNDHQTLIRGPDNIWTTRPSTPPETPPPRRE
jgi:hypothetical protein